MGHATKRDTPRRRLSIAQLLKLQYLGVDELALCFGVSNAYIYAEHAAGRLPAKRFGRRLIIKRSDFESLAS